MDNGGLCGGSGDELWMEMTQQQGDDEQFLCTQQADDSESELFLRQDGFSSFKLDLGRSYIVGVSRQGGIVDISLGPPIAGSSSRHARVSRDTTGLVLVEHLLSSADYLYVGVVAPGSATAVRVPHGGSAALAAG